MEEFRDVQQNHLFNIENLKSFLKNQLKFEQSILNQIKIKQFIHGQSNPTFLLDFNSKKLVLRKKPHGKLLKGAHMIEREFRILKSLYSVGFPVPNAIVLCEDESIIGTPFYIMDYVEGRIFRDFRLSSLSPDEREEIYEEFIRVMALLQSYNIEDLKLENYGKSDNYFERIISTWSKAYRESETSKIKEMEYLIQWLPENIPNYSEMKKCLVHGDFRLDNVIFHPVENRILAVLDWELSTLGPQIADISYTMLMFYAPTSLLGLGKIDKGFSGIPSEAAFASKFFEMAKLNQPKESDWYFFISCNIFKMAGISQGVYKRSLQGNASSPFAESFLQKTKLAAYLSYELSLKSLIFKEKSERIKALKSNTSIFKFFNNKLSDRFFSIYLDVEDFMDKYIYPNERKFIKNINLKYGKDRWSISNENFSFVDSLKNKAQTNGLWNLFLPEVSNLSNLEYAFICQIMGRSLFFAPEIFNCSAPDTGNMEVLFRYGSPWQKEKYLKPLLDGKIRSCFAMTEKGVASSDATNISSSIKKDPNDSEYYIVNGRKWWISGAGDPRCSFAIFMGKSDDFKQQPFHKQHTMIIVPINSKGVKIIRPMNVYGYDDAPHGHMDMVFENVRVHRDNIILGEGRGFEIAQGRLGPGRIHHCMRIFGVAERALENLCDRLATRKTFGKMLNQNEDVIKIVAECETKLLQAKLLVLYAAFMIDQVGAKSAKNEIAMIKIVAPNIGLDIIDRAIQIHGAEGVSQDTFLAYVWAAVRTLKIADGPDEVHLRSLGKSVLNKYARPKF